METKAIAKQTHICVHLSFNGRCREAMAFYQTCFGGDLQCMAVAESPLRKQWPKELQHHILQAKLKNNTLLLLGSDIGSTNVRSAPHAISLALECATDQELRHYFEQLSEGGKITHPPHGFVDGTIAALCDKFGINWILKY